MITWLDSRQADGAWQWISQYEKLAPIEVISVGWLIQDDDETKVLAQSMAPDGDNLQTAGRKAIPARCVKKIEPLIEVTKPRVRKGRVEVSATRLPKQTGGRRSRLVKK